MSTRTYRCIISDFIPINPNFSRVHPAGSSRQANNLARIPINHLAPRKSEKKFMKRIGNVSHLNSRHRSSIVVSPVSIIAARY